ncbi:phage antirepressor KilAC domain-containing protein [Paenibacillus durus]|uniref:Uncharacterized protein n=1 Tax=Paenibacillus durus TaxID=44251 RepID=A0A089HSB1_PAEDU|nr:phage antirepressor KilAC domain-containing protein [Paenibacillus durus]AIQ13645.1 hypothetical protein PDUR_18275 [Paenibacillus durus]
MTITLTETAVALGENEVMMREFLYRRKVLRRYGLPLKRYIPKYFVIREHLVTDTKNPPYIERYTGVTAEGIALIRKLREGEVVDVRQEDIAA